MEKGLFIQVFFRIFKYYKHIKQKVMKKLISILVLGVAMISCQNTPTKVENPKQETTLEIQQLARIDSTTYKVVEKENVMYIVSTKDYAVVKKVRNESGFVATAVVCIFIILLVMLILIMISN